MSNDIGFINNSTVNTQPPVGGPKITQPKSSGNKFLSVLGGVARTALNYVVPGLGSAVGGIIIGGAGSTSSNRGVGITGSYQEIILEQQRSFLEMQRFSQAQHSIQMQQNRELMAQSQRAASDLLVLQNRVSSQAQEFTTISNLLKSRHDSRSHAIQNLKT